MILREREAVEEDEEVTQESIIEEAATVSQGAGGTNGKNVWGISMFGTPAGAGTEWARRTQAYVYNIFPLPIAKKKLFACTQDG